MNGRSSLGIGENIAALIAYLFGWLSGLIIFLLEKDSRFVRFHALQSLMFFGGMSLILTILGRVPVVGALAITAGGILSFVYWVLGMIKAYRGELYRFPVVGELAAGQLGD